MSTATQARPGLDRNLIERLVREALRRAGEATAMPPRADRQAGQARSWWSTCRPGTAMSRRQDLEVLFGKGHQLTPYKGLYQDGFFAAEETVTLIGPRHRMINNLRILGPVPGPQPGGAGLLRRHVPGAGLPGAARAAIIAIRPGRI